MVLTVRGSQGKSKYQGAKVKKDAENSLNCFTQSAYNSSNFFSVRFARKFFFISSFKFVSPPLFLVRLQAIESQHWYFT